MFTHIAASVERSIPMCIDETSLLIPISKWEAQVRGAVGVGLCLGGATAW